MQALLVSQSTEFLICTFHHGSHKLYQLIISMTHSVTLLPCPETGLGIARVRQFWHDNCYHPTTANTKSGLMHLCMLSLLVLQLHVPSFLFAYFTIALKHGLNEVTNIILFTLFLPQLILSATILRG